MKKFSIILVILLGATVTGFAQQDPDDPGMQDSLIIQTVTVDQPMRSILVDIYFVTDDSVAYINIPLLWTSENDSIYPSGFLYPENPWGLVLQDTILPAQHRINIVGYSFESLNTFGLRCLLASIQFQVTNFQSQIITIDSTWDDRNFSLIFGLYDGITEITPAFIPGGIIYNPLGVEEEPGQAPGVFYLAQNYPNPFNAQTTISYSLPETGPVTLTIYNILGQKVATLFDGIQTSGEHRVVWDAKNQPSGIYFTRLESGDHKSSSQMLLLK